MTATLRIPVRFTQGAIAGVEVTPLVRHADARGSLCETWRADEPPAGFCPRMTYVSITLPGAARGPHAHRRQTDLFAFPGPGDFTVYLWDARPPEESPTAGRRMTFAAGEAHPLRVVVPPGVVHAYRNTGAVPAVSFCSPDRLYAGRDRREPPDEIRHEDDPLSPYILD